MNTLFLVLGVVVLGVVVVGVLLLLLVGLAEMSAECERQCDEMALPPSKRAASGAAVSAASDNVEGV